jgi:5-methylthioadenosine/S-adenosylhomocysteine deaminase
VRTVDVVIRNACLFTLDDESRRIDPGAIAVDGSSIVAVDETARVESEYEGRLVLDGTGMYVVPGFVNTHTHLFQTALKGLGNDLPLHSWIKSVPAPMFASMDLETLDLSVRVGCINALRSGTTTLLDYVYPTPKHEAFDTIVHVLEESGIRALLGRGVADMASADGYPVTGYYPPLVEPLEAAMEDCERLHEACRRAPGGRVKFCLAPPNPRTSTDRALAAMRDFAATHDSVVSMHICESPRDDEIARERYGMSAVEWLHASGILGGRFVAVHCVNLDGRAVEIFAEDGVGVSHNPVSNMYVGNGIAPIRQLLDAGVRVTLGTDGAAVNNNDMLESMKVGALLLRVVTKDAGAITPEGALRMATIEGARALGLGHVVGSIESGKRADVVMVDLRNARSSPHHDPLGAFVFSSNTSAVRTVLVDGRVLVRDGELVGVDERDIVARAQRASSELVARAWAGAV